MKTRLQLIRPGWWSGNLLLLLFLSACTLPSPQMREESSGLFSLSPKAFCEPSGVIFDGSFCIFANDKPIPGRSPLFRFPIEDGRLRTDVREDLLSPVFQEGRKWEDLAISPEGKYLLATTAFDRPQKAYQRFAYWPAGDPQKARSLTGVIKKGIQFVLGDPPYFKVEGLVCLPSGQTLFGIRARGESWKTASEVIQIVSFPFQVRDGKFEIGSESSLWFESESIGVPESVGISGLEYDRYRDHLYVLFSFEVEGRGAGGYLGVLRKGESSMVLVRNSIGSIHRFSRKPEGITVLDRDRILVVFDEDRRESPERKKHQAIFSIFRWQ